MISSPDYLFVYGTLRNGSANSYARSLHENSDYVGAGVSPGLLYDLGGYPGAISDPLCTGIVHGEVFNIAGRKNQIVAMLDEYEGFRPEETQPEYIREKIVVLVDEQEVICWAYLYNWSLMNKQPIESGDYFLR